jgi:outer membrane protein TolC
MTRPFAALCFGLTLVSSAPALATPPVQIEPSEPSLAPPSLDPAPAPAPADSPLAPISWATDARGTVTLPEVLDHANEYAPALLIVRGRQSIGEADLEAASPIFIQDPVLWAALGGRLTPNERTSFEMQLQVYQQVEIAGERRLRIQAAKRLIDYTQADVDRVAWEVEVRVRESFREAVVARLKLDTARKQREFNDHMLDLVGRQLEQGDISALDYRLAEVQAMQAQQAEIAAENDYRLACRKVTVLAGWQDEFEPKGALEGTRSVSPETDLHALAEQHQKQLEMLDKQVERAEVVKKLAKRNIVPEPQLGIYYGREVDPFANIGMNVVMGTVAFSIPTWQRNRREIAYAKAELDIAKSERNAFAAQMPGRIDAAEDRVNASHEQVALYQESIVPNLESNVELLQKGYDFGELTVFEASIARERFFSVQQSVLDAHGDYYRALADLESALGTSPFPDADSALPVDGVEEGPEPPPPPP